MKTLFEVVAILLVFAAAQATAAQERVITPQANTVYVMAEGKFEADPDTALVQFNVAAQEGSSKRAYERAAEATEQVRTVLRKAGVDPKAAEFGFFSIQPVYEWRPQQRLVGYRAMANVTMRVKDFTRVGPIVEQFAAIQGVGQHSVNYILGDQDAAKNKAVADAFRRARTLAATIAEGGGRTLGELNYASVDTFEQVRPMVMMGRAEAMAADAAAPPTEGFTPQRVTVSARVNASFNLR